jgi:hypothetical protein
VNWYPAVHRDQYPFSRILAQWLRECDAPLRSVKSWSADRSAGKDDMLVPSRTVSARRQPTEEAKLDLVRIICSPALITGNIVKDCEKICALDRYCSSCLLSGGDV